MRRTLLIGWAAAMVAAFCACDFLRDSSTNIVLTQGQGQSGTSASPTPGPSLPPGVCPPVRAVNASVVDGSSVVAVGTQVTLDATPVRDIALDPAAETQCNLAAGATWSAPDFPCKLLTGAGPFNPLLTSEVPAVCTTAPSVQGIVGPDVSVEFR